MNRTETIRRIESFRAAATVYTEKADELERQLKEAASVVYERAYLTTERYNINAVLVKDNSPTSRIVLECECPAFRFTKGELRDGKACKHIERFVGKTGRHALYYEAKDALIKEGLASSRHSYALSPSYQ